jgi:carboxypeptidase C (cathepsin A)
MVFYSGDTDGAVPTYGTKRWLAKLNWPLKTTGGQWRTWHSGPTKQVAGFQQNYDGLDFFTFRGVGHMAPQWAPLAGQEFITNWIHNIAQT